MQSESTLPLADRRIWVRILYMLLFWLAYAVAELLAGLTALFQTGSALLTGHTNLVAQRFGKNLRIYIAQILDFVTFNDEYLPFPFNDWPDEAPSETQWNPREDDLQTEPNVEHAEVEADPEVPSDDQRPDER